jgi:iron-sulfur cluster assembly accessory protein
MAESEHTHGSEENRPFEPGELPSPAINLTPKAVEMIKRTRKKEGLGEAYALRLGVVGGGCSGFQYSLNFDCERHETDTTVGFDGVDVVIDEASLPYIAGTTLDYVEGLHGAGFKFNNPRATHTCGCGSSFTV